uniref:FCH and double SH3 domains 1 n=1 Tax=Athene cunicularia TaxID=194338 RepID=A0A663N2D7_ATHCN
RSPPPNVKLTQEVRVHLLEQLSGLQSKQQRDDVVRDSKGTAGAEGADSPVRHPQKLAGMQESTLPFLNAPVCRSVAAVWKGVIEGTAHAGQVRVTASESYRALATEAARTARLSKERMLKKGIERLQKAQAELLETVKELDKAKKQFTHLQRSSEVAKDKAADVEARLQKSDRRIFHTKASLQKLSAKVSSAGEQQLVGVQNEYGFALVSATSHLEHYRRVELPAAMQVGAARTTPRPLLWVLWLGLEGTCELPQPHAAPLLQVCREQDLLLFLQDHPAFALASEQRFHHPVLTQVCLLPPGDDGASLEKEARRWATRVARDCKNKAHSEEVLQRLESRRQQVPEVEAATMERQMEEARENIRKAEVGSPGRKLRAASSDGPCWAVSRVKAEARLALLRAAGLDAAPAGLDLSEFDDYEDSDEPDEDNEPGPTARTYPYTCRVIFGYQADELSITQGEELEIIEDGDAEEWVKARNKVGQVGYVPEKYLLSLGGELGDEAAWLVRALYDYEGQSPEELSFPEGAIIRVLPRAPGEVDDGFWMGDFNGRIGCFPSLVVEELTGGQGAAGQVSTRRVTMSPRPTRLRPVCPITAMLCPPSYATRVHLKQGEQPWCISTASPLLSPQLRAPPPPPGRAPEPDPELHFS